MATSNHEASNSPLLKSPVDVEKGSDGQPHKVRDYRKLAICSIICGLSCVGIVSLIYSVKTRESNKRSGGKISSEAKEYSKKTLKWGIGAFVALVGLIVVIILLLGLVSYLLTFID